MSKVDELIKELCPGGVVFRIVDDVCNFLNGKGHEKSIVEDGTYIVVNSKFVSTEGLVKKYSDSQISPIYKNDVLMVMSDLPNGKALAKCFFVEENDKYTLNQRICSLTVKNLQELLPKFLFYILNRNQQLLRFDNGVDQTNLRKSDILKISIPVPPLPIQQEIVSILDKFTQLEAELEAELEARKKQYNYYRDQLLSFEGKKVEWKTLGEVCVSVSSGGTPLSTRSEYYNGKIPWLRTQEVRFNEIYDTDVKITEKAVKESSAKWIPANCVIIAISGATAGRSAINKIPLTTNQHCCNLEIDTEKAIYRYVFHWVSNKYLKLKSMGRGARADLNSGLIKSFEIPIPPIEEQQRIVGILDKFDSLVNDISIGLPAEIKARRKQYEYYREQLLTFKS